MQEKRKYSVLKPCLTKATFSLLILLCFFFDAVAQFNFHLVIKSLPSKDSIPGIFVAGNFNGWDPGKTAYQFTRVGDSITLNIPALHAGEYMFKFTKGDWGKVEVTAAGNSVNNRVVKLSSDTTLTFSIEAWADDFPETIKQHTASANVQIMDTAFFIPQLSRTRKIWIYLPAGYSTSKKKYPVLYMQDGQNLFDEYTSGYGEWGVDECLDSIISNGKEACIVVGIESGAKRINEYNPYDNEKYGKGEGEQYVNFLVETLKPFIDKRYRTLRSKENTFIAGSSLGGIISYYAMLRYPDVFGKAGIFSPAFWIAPKLNELTDSLSTNVKGQFFFYAGEDEDETMVPLMERMADKLGENSTTLIYAVTDSSGKHNEQSWRKWFAEFYLWIMGNGLSYQIKINH